jgi:hypothetical protein
MSVRQFAIRPSFHFLEFDRQRSIMGRHFPVMPPGNRINRAVGALVKHTGALNKLLSVGHWNLTECPFVSICEQKVLQNTVGNGFVMQPFAANRRASIGPLITDGVLRSAATAHSFAGRGSLTESAGGNMRS